jgi:hypothetical protein
LIVFDDEGEELDDDELEEIDENWYGALGKMDEELELDDPRSLA